MREDFPVGQAGYLTREIQAELSFIIEIVSLGDNLDRLDFDVEGQFSGRQLDDLQNADRSLSVRNPAIAGVLSFRVSPLL